MVRQDSNVPFTMHLGARSGLHFLYIDEVAHMCTHPTILSGGTSVAVAYEESALVPCSDAVRHEARWTRNRDRGNSNGIYPSWRVKM